jgi:predicted nucleotidyltransferase
VKSLSEITEIPEAEKDHLAAEYGVTIVGVFCSYARDEQRPDSDLDLLIELERPPALA